MDYSIFHSSLLKFISEKYPYTQIHPIENTALQKAWGLDVKIYRSLPRNTFHEDLEISEVRAPFRNLTILKKKLIDSPLLSLYTDSPPKSKIVLLTWVYWDGLGDYYAQLDCANLIEKHFPNNQLTLITCLCSQQFPPGTHPFPLEKRSNQHFILFEKKKTPVFPQFLQEKMKQANLIFQFPTYYPYIKELIEMLGPHTKHECLGESGFIDFSVLDPIADPTLNCGYRCMGLHFLEKGIFIKPIPSKKPSLSYYFAYTHTAEGLLCYVQALIKWKKKDLRLYTFKIQHVIKILQKGLPNVKAAHIKVDNTYTSVPFAKKGIVLHFEVLQNISHDRFLTLLQGSEDFVACTGDGSLFEAISAGKIFYYDAPKHKKEFQKDLLALAQIRTPEALRFFENPLTIQCPQVRKALHKLTKILRNEHSVNNTLCNIIHRALCHQAHPEVEQVENRALEAFIKDEINAPSALCMIKKSVDKIQYKK